ncbi:trypsin beta-like [Leptopilina boulardi]|uniref:trypsin beta-like n=1 Tax=Leptopilina boulardi TaxID=63433 RepID=UPI0021F67D5E|nr:trypsin beta-like [Leptopilina boulardi]
MNMKVIFHTILITCVPWTIQLSNENLPLKKINDSFRIVGGTNALIKDFPHQVSIQLNGSHICGGSIISKKWILTAAHCINNIQIKSIQIRSGSTFTTHGGTLHQISQIISHEFYNKWKITNDIALIRVKSNFKWCSRRRKIQLARKEIKSGIMASIIGWGVKKEGGSISLDLQKVKIPIVSFFECRIYLRYIERGHICAGYKSGCHDACQGDSGGPLVVKNSLVGIVSSGEGCARPNKPGVYTEVAYYRDWIKNKSGC